MNFAMTAGIRSLAREAACYWLINAIFSYQFQCSRDTAGNKPLAYFQVWVLSVKERKGDRRYPFLEPTDCAAILTCWRDTPTKRKRPPIEQRIDFTDFPLPEIQLYVERGTLMLPEEY